jgi:3-dehydroquinate synthase
VITYQKPYFCETFRTIYQMSIEQQPHTEYPIVFGNSIFVYLEENLSPTRYSKCFILVDENTYKYCLPLLLESCALEIPFEIIEIESGEKEKTIETVLQLWGALTDLGADRKSVLLNLGGGVLTDMGGFVASTYKRGIDFFNLPTTLLGMVDASIGGKTGIDFNGIKNHIGTFKNPKALLIHTAFLETLNTRQMRSGLAEMLKHGLIADKTYWQKLQLLQQLDISALESLIATSVSIKTRIVASDPEEQHFRKGLNFGHTIGHAVESYFLEKNPDNPLLHGEAIAVGMIIESYLSFAKNLITKAELIEISQNIRDLFGTITFNENDCEQINQWLKHDKKNSKGNVNFVLLNGLGNFVADQLCERQHIDSGFDWYINPNF